MARYKKKQKTIEDNPAKNLGRKKKIIFSVIQFLIPVLILLIFELFLRVFHYGDSYNLFVEFDYYGKEYKKCNPDFGKKYFYRFNYTSPANDYFLADKPENGFRIFVTGSSTVYGFPYSSGVMFSRILHERLQDSYPDKYIEVINTAITAVNSYTLQDKIKEILKEGPDAILIYAGHNEFYGALGIGSKEGIGQIRGLKILHLKFLNLKLYQFVRRIISGSQTFMQNKDTLTDRESATLMERIVSNKNIEYNSELYIQAHNHYKKNLEYILKKANKKNVPVIMSELVSNVRDLKPFGTTNTGDDKDARVIYEKAKKYDQEGNYEKAKEYYYLAKELDCIRFRASEEINDIIHELAIKYNAGLVPMIYIFEKQSPEGIIGNNLLTEHVHPNVNGFFLMADAFYNSITANNIIGVLDSSNYKSSEYYRKNWGFTPLDSIYADLKIRQLTGGWPFRPDTLINEFIYKYVPVNIIDSFAYQAVRYDDISLEMAHKRLAKYYSLQNNYEKAFKEYLSLLKIDPNDIKNYIETGDLLLKTGNYDRALEIYSASLKIKREVYSLYKIGELYNKKGDYLNSIIFLEEVRLKDPEFFKVEILRLLYQAYNNINEKEKAEKIYTELSGLSASANNRERIVIYTSPKIKESINKAIKLVQENKYDEALQVLFEANRIQESPLTNRMVGELYLQKKDMNALIYLKKAYYEYSSDPNFLNTLCYACFYFNDFQTGEKTLKELKQLDPGNKNIVKFEHMLSKNSPN